MFEFSPEEGTPAAEHGAAGARTTVKRARFERIMELQQGISRAHQQAMIGRRLEVLVEGRVEETEHLLAGRHAQQAPEIDGLTYVNDGVAYPGEIVTVEVTDASDYDLVGKVVARDAARPSRPLPKGPRRRTGRSGGGAAGRRREAVPRLSRCCAASVPAGRPPPAEHRAEDAAHDRAADLRARRAHRALRHLADEVAGRAAGRSLGAAAAARSGGGCAATASARGLRLPLQELVRRLAVDRRVVAAAERRGWRAPARAPRG